MKNKKNFTTTISNEEHLARVEETYNTEVIPFLEGNRRAYKKHLEEKKSLDLTPTQKASAQCQNPV